MSAKASPNRPGSVSCVSCTCLLGWPCLRRGLGWGNAVNSPPWKGLINLTKKLLFSLKIKRAFPHRVPLYDRVGSQTAAGEAGWDLGTGFGFGAGGGKDASPLCARRDAASSRGSLVVVPGLHNGNNPGCLQKSAVLPRV